MARIGNALKIFGSAIVFFFKNPRFIVPIFICWAAISSVALYMYFELNIMQMKGIEALIYIFIFISISTFFIAVSSLIILELLEQHETESRTSLFIALKDVLIRDLWKTLPIIIIWSLLVTIITIIKAMLKARKGKHNKSSSEVSNYSAKNAAMLLSGSNSPTTLTDIGFQLIQKSVRFMVFMMLPAIAWEDENSLKAAKKGIRVFKNTWGEVLTGFTLTFFMGLFIGIPVALTFAYERNQGGTLPDYVWYGVIIYIGFISSFSLLIEQLFTAGVYLWHMKWEQALEKAKDNDDVLPKITDIPKPSFLDNVPDLL